MLLDIGAVVFTVILTLVMKKRGGMKALLSLTGLILSIIIAISVYPYLSQAVYNTPLPKVAEEKIQTALEEQYEKVNWESLDAMPTFIQNAVGDYADKKVEEGSITLAQEITKIFIDVLVFVLVVIATKILFAMLSWVLKLAVKLPVLKQCNSFLGALCGFAMSVGILWITTWLLGVIGTSNAEVAAFTRDSYTVMIMSNIAPF